MLRKHYFVKPKIQLWYLYLLCFVLMLSFLLSYYIFMRFLEQIIGATQNIDAVISLFTQVFFCTAGVSILIVLIFSIFYSHKLIGPMFFFEKVMTRLKDGDFTVGVHYRKHDAAIELAKKIDCAIANVKSAVLEDRKKIEEIKSAIDSSETEKAKQKLSELTQWFKIEEKSKK